MTKFPYNGSKEYLILLSKDSSLDKGPFVVDNLIEMAKGKVGTIKKTSSYEQLAKVLIKSCMLNILK
ncbi:MAG: hypothetical protein RCG15_00005 [Candidatus Rickettsia vulgarisii]